MKDLTIREPFTRGKRMGHYRAIHNATLGIMDIFFTECLAQVAGAIMNMCD